MEVFCAMHEWHDIIPIESTFLMDFSSLRVSLQHFVSVSPAPAPSRQWYLFIEVFSLCHHEGAILRHEDGFVLDFICFFQKKFSVIYWCVLFDMRRVSHGKICLVGEKVSSKKLTFPWDASCQSGCEGKSEKAFQDRGHNGLLESRLSWCQRRNDWEC